MVILHKQLIVRSYVVAVLNQVNTAGAYLRRYTASVYVRTCLRSSVLILLVCSSSLADLQRQMLSTSSMKITCIILT